MNIRAILIAGGLLLGTSFAAHAQYSIGQFVIGNGTGPVGSFGGLSINGTIGQPIIGPAVGATYTDNQGFWYGATPTGPDGVADHTGNAANFELEQNYPNPFNPTTTIYFDLPSHEKITLRVLNLLGVEVRRLIDGASYEQGRYKYEFSADDLPSGTYIYRLEAGSSVLSKKMVLMK